MTDDEEDSWEMALSFVSDDPEYCRGFEAGVIWGKLRAGERPVVGLVRSDQAEMWMRIADAMKLHFKADCNEWDEDWVWIVFSDNQLEDL